MNISIFVMFECFFNELDLVSKKKLQCLKIHLLESNFSNHYMHMTCLRLHQEYNTINTAI